MPCKRSSAAPIPFGVGFQFLGHAVSLRQLRHDQLHAVSCRFVNLSAILSYVHPAIPSGRFAYTEKRSIPAGRCGHRPLRSSIERALSEFHTSNIQRAQMRQPARRIVRLGNLIGRPPEGRSLTGAPSANGRQKQNAFLRVSAISRPQRPFLPYLFPQEGKDMACGAKPAPYAFVSTSTISPT